jgi:hypothetical protein
MTPFHQFRLWARRAPIPERAAAVVGAALAVFVVAWLLTPASHPGNRAVGVVAGGSSAQVNGTTGTTVAGSTSAAVDSTIPEVGTGGGGATAGAAPAASTQGPSSSQSAAGGGGPGGGSGGQGCVSPPGTDQGVTATQIKIAIIIVNIVGPAANGSFGLASASEQQEDYQQVTDAINASGGVACRHLVPQFYTVNPVDQSNLQQTCLQIIQAGVFAVIDYGGYFTSPALANCYPQNHLPFLSSTLLPVKQRDQFYPYLFGHIGMVDALYHNAIFALHDRGFFDAANGFQKLGIVYRDCVPEVFPEFTGWLNQVGVSSSQIVSYDLGCPSAFAAPSDIEQAILKFQQSGVTHVTESEDQSDFANFTVAAQQQGFHPKYGIPQDGIVATSYGSQHPDYTNIAGAIAIEPDTWGEERTPGYVPSAGTAKCNAIFQAQGRPPVYQQPVGTGGSVCSQLWMIQAAINHAPALQRSALAAGLQAAKSSDTSYPVGPNDFSAPHATTGGQFWRVVQFLGSCNCWQVVDPTFHASYPGTPE